MPKVKCKVCYNLKIRYKKYMRLANKGKAHHIKEFMEIHQKRDHPRAKVEKDKAEHGKS